jgi:hypothetical protein
MPATEEDKFGTTTASEQSEKEEMAKLLTIKERDE